MSTTKENPSTPAPTPLNRPRVSFANSLPVHRRSKEDNIELGPIYRNPTNEDSDSLGFNTTARLPSILTSGIDADFESLSSLEEEIQKKKNANSHNWKSWFLGLFSSSKLATTTFTYTSVSSLATAIETSTTTARGAYHILDLPTEELREFRCLHVRRLELNVLGDSEFEGIGIKFTGLTINSKNLPDDVDYLPNGERYFPLRSDGQPVIPVVFYPRELHIFHHQKSTEIRQCSFDFSASELGALFDVSAMKTLRIGFVRFPVGLLDSLLDSPVLENFYFSKSIIDEDCDHAALVTKLCRIPNLALDCEALDLTLLDIVSIVNSRNPKSRLTLVKLSAGMSITSLCNFVERCIENKVLFSFRVNRQLTDAELALLNHEFENGFDFLRTYLPKHTIINSTPVYPSF